MNGRQPLDPQRVAQLRRSHTPEAIRARLAVGPAHSYLRDFVYGAIDGAVTTFAVVSGVAGADLPSAIIIVLGLANLVGDGFSMAVSNYQGTRADEQLVENARRTELDHIRHVPEGEREEIRQIFQAKGFEGEDLERAVDVITAREEQWVDMMLREELGLSPDGPSAMKAAVTTFLAFLTVGFIPLLPFVAGLLLHRRTIPYPFPTSCVLTGIAFFAVGAAKGRFVQHRWYLAGLETLAAGGSAALLAFGVGRLLGGLVH